LFSEVKEMARARISRRPLKLKFDGQRQLRARQSGQYWKTVRREERAARNQK
jgi:hypothetical protein